MLASVEKTDVPGLFQMKSDTPFMVCIHKIGVGKKHFSTKTFNCYY